MDGAAVWSRPSAPGGPTDSLVGILNGVDGQISYAATPTPSRTVPLTLGGRAGVPSFIGKVGRILLLDLTGMSDATSAPWRTLAWDRTAPWWVE